MTRYYPTDARQLRACVIATVLVVVGFKLRLYAGGFGGNHDQRMWEACVQLAHRDGWSAVYTSTLGECLTYNYTPIWLWLLLLLDKLPMPLSASLTWMLSFTDLAIAALLWRWWDWQAAVLFWLCPVCIVISGYHRQFDNMALLVGLVAMRMVRE